MELDASRISGWIDSLARKPHEIVEIFVERRREVVFEWRDGEVEQTRVWVASGLSARSRRQGEENLVFVPRSDEAGAREAVRALQKELERPTLPVKPSHAEEPATLAPPADAERWRKRLSTLLARLAPRHRFRLTLTRTERHLIPARGSPCSFERQLFSLEGTFTAASRRRDETRSFSFHAPEAASTVDELKTALALAGQPRETMVPCGDGVMDVVLANGSAAVLFHEILSHPLEAGVASPLSTLEGARLATPELDVCDDPTRLDLFGGYVFDDEGTRARPVKLLDAGRLGHRLTDRAHAEPESSNGHARRAGPSDAPLARSSNILVAGGHSTSEEMARRLGSGLWIDALDGGSVELASGGFRLSFPRAHRVRRGRMADECGPGTLAGDILSALKSVEPLLGRQVRPLRAFGWCARAGQVVPVQGAAPDVLIRGLAIRSAA
ncbi:MAG: TldD/PmbA family protein [Thermoanaerobaculia bacterium]